MKPITLIIDSYKHFTKEYGNLVAMPAIFLLLVIMLLLIAFIRMEITLTTIRAITASLTIAAIPLITYYYHLKD